MWQEDRAALRRPLRRERVEVKRPRVHSHLRPIVGKRQIFVQSVRNAVPHGQKGHTRDMTHPLEATAEITVGCLRFDAVRLEQ
jgi:hypothetical protein